MTNKPKVDKIWIKRFDKLWQTNPVTPEFSEYDNFKFFIFSILEEYGEAMDGVIGKDEKYNPNKSGSMFTIPAQNQLRAKQRQVKHNLDVKWGTRK